MTAKYSAFHCGLDESNPEFASCSDKHELSLVDAADRPGRMQPNTAHLKVQMRYFIQKVHGLRELL